MVGLVCRYDAQVEAVPERTFKDSVSRINPFEEATSFNWRSLSTSCRSLGVLESLQ